MLETMSACFLREDYLEKRSFNISGSFWSSWLRTSELCTLIVSIGCFSSRQVMCMLETDLNWHLFCIQQQALQSGPKYIPVPQSWHIYVGNAFAKSSTIMVTAGGKTRGSKGWLNQVPLNERARPSEQAGVVVLFSPTGVLWFLHFCPLCPPY